jgi:polyketide cyclase/dehydrase/lipid transport protein
MQLANFHVNHLRRSAGRAKMTAGLMAAGACLGLIPPAAHAATLTRSVVVAGTTSQIWAMVGPFCAIKDWLPPVGSCTETSESPPVRTLVTKDGQATFVERQVTRSDKEHFYSYEFVSSPLPVSHYQATIRVVALDSNRSIVTWSASYAPDKGRAAEADQALRGIYAAGLSTIQLQAAQQLAAAAAKEATP